MSDTKIDIREQPGRENAAERCDRLRANSEFTGWAGYCTSPSYCTRACDDCRQCERSASERRGVKG